GEKKIEDCILPSVEDWLITIMNADQVITDSYHGTLFSLIFNKELICIANPRRGVARITSLLKKIECLNRLVTDLDQVDLKFEKKIDYRRVNRILEKERIKSYNFLNQALSN